MIPIPVLLNTGSGGSGRHSATDVAAALDARGVSAEVETCEPGALEVRLRSLVRDAPPLIAVGGGDGTMRTAAQVLADGPTALGPIPMGRHDHFARRLGLPDVEAVAAAIAGGRTREVALGSIGDDVFLDTAVLGAYNGMVRLRERVRPVLGSRLGAAMSFAVTWSRWPVFPLVLQTEASRVVRRVPLVWVGTGAGIFPAPHRAPVASPGDPLEVVLPPPGGRWAVLGVLPRLLLAWAGRPADLDDALEVLRASRLEIAGPGRLPVTLDGEPKEVETPVALALGKRVLRVVAPPDPG